MYNKVYNDSTLRGLLESIHAEDGHSLMKIKSLTETEVLNEGTSLAGRLINTIKNKAKGIDYGTIDNSKGDITKYSGYKELKESIDLLVRMSTNYPSAPKEIFTLKRSLEFLEKYKTDFTTAYKKKEAIKKGLYRNFVLSLVQSTSLLISSTVEFIKQPLGNYNAIFKEAKNIKGDYHIVQLERILKMETKGKLNVFFRTPDPINESTNRLNEAAFSVTAGIIAVVIAILLNLRHIVYLTYRLRVRVSEHLLNLAYFVEAHHQSLDSDIDDNKKIISKQKKVVDKLRALSDKISVDYKASTRNIDNEIEENNKEIQEIGTGDSDILDIVIAED